MSSDTAPFRIFLNYRRDDASGYAGRLRDSLEAGVGEESGFREEQIFRDIDTIPPGADFRTYINEAVASCDVFLAIIGKQWLNSADKKGRRRLASPADFVRVEIEAALQKDVPVVPVLVQDAKMPSQSRLPKSISELCRRNAFELSDGRWPYDVGRLVTWLKSEERKKREKTEREVAYARRWQQFADTHQVGDVVEGRVTRYGVLNLPFVRIPPGVIASFAAFGLGDTHKLAEGDTVRVKIHAIDRDKREMTVALPNSSPFTFQ